MEKTKLIRISYKHHKKLRLYAAKENSNMKEVIEDLIDEVC